MIFFDLKHLFTDGEYQCTNPNEWIPQRGVRTHDLLVIRLTTKAPPYKIQLRNLE